MKTTTETHPRKCFTRSCGNTAAPGRWECDQCRELIHAASVKATERASDLAATLPHTTTGDQVGPIEAHSIRSNER